MQNEKNNKGCKVLLKKKKEKKEANSCLTHQILKIYLRKIQRYYNGGLFVISPHADAKF